jgi:hypothetical protein
MLSPFYSMSQKHPKAIPEDLLYRLTDIVSEAGDLSRQMRRCGDVVYHWPPTFKDGMHLPSDSNEPVMLPNQSKPSTVLTLLQRSSTQTAWNASTSAI